MKIYKLFITLNYLERYKYIKSFSKCMHKFLCFGLFLIGSLLMSAISLNGNLLSNALAIENNSYNNYDNSQRYEKDNSDKYRTDPSQQSNNEDNYGYDDKN